MLGKSKEDYDLCSLIDSNEISTCRVLENQKQQKKNNLCLVFGNLLAFRLATCLALALKLVARGYYS